MKNRLLFIFLILTSFSFSQNNRVIDSLLSVLKTAKEDTNKVNTLIALGTKFKETSEFDKGIEYSKEALKLAEKLNFKQGAANSLNCLANNFQNIGDYPSALTNYTNALKIYEETNDKKGIAAVLNNIAVVYYSKGDYLNALKGFSSALEINKALANKKYQANNYGNMGVIYQGLGNYSEALKYHLLALKITEENKDINRLAYDYNNIGIIYQFQRNYPLALRNYLIALKWAEKTGNKKMMAISNNNLGSTFEAIDSTAKALKYFNISLNIYRKIGDKNSEATIYGNLARICESQIHYSEARKNYLMALKILEENDSKLDVATFYNLLGGLCIKEKKTAEARNLIIKALQISKEIGSKEDCRGSYLLMAQLDSLEGNYKQSLENYKLCLTYQDSLINEDNTKKIVEIQMQYDFDKKENEAKIEQTKKDAKVEAEKRNKEFLLIGLVSLLFITIIIARLLFRQSKLKSEQKAILLEQKLLRTQMNPHFIFNSLTSIDSYIATRDQSLARKYLASFSKLMRNILENSRVEYITLEKEITTLEDYLTLQKINHEENFIYNVSLDKNIDTQETLIPPMLLQPFIENAIKYGITATKQGLIDISFKHSGQNLLVEIRDNGLGITKNDPALTNGHVSLSTTITQERLANINTRKKSKISFQIQDLSTLDKSLTGTLVTFTIPFS